MQFRHVGKRIQCIRSIYNKETKKCEQKQICSIPDTTTAIPEPLGVLAALSNQELNDLAVFLNNRNANARSEELRQLYENAPALLADLGEIIKNNPDWIKQEWVNLIWERTTLLQKSLNKSGFAKPKKNNSTEKKERKPKHNQTSSTIQAAEETVTQAIQVPKKKIHKATEKKQGGEPANQSSNSQSGNQTKANKQKSIFAEYHTEIVSLLNAGRTANKIVEYLQSVNPKKADSFTYNGVRSYIRRNVKK